MRLWIFLILSVLGNPLVHAEPTLDISALEAPIELVGQELDPSLLENMPAPTEPPAQIRLRMVIEKDQWMGSQSGITLSTQAIFRTAASWEKFWNLAILPYNRQMPPVPPVDFEKEMVIGVFMGSQPHPGYQIAIKEHRLAVRGDQQQLTIKFKNESKMQSVFAPPFTVQPFHLKKIPAFMGPIAFLEVK